MDNRHRPSANMRSRLRLGLIVMGAYGQSRVVEMLFGSTTGGVLESGRCPVLLAA